MRYTLSIDTQNAQALNRAWDHCHAVAALQGLVNRDAPQLYLRFVDSAHARVNVDDYWLGKLTAPEQWLHGRPQQTVTGMVQLVQRFREHIAGRQL